MAIDKSPGTFECSIVIRGVEPARSHKVTVRSHDEGPILRRFARGFTWAAAIRWIANP